jgi:TetR/AcrR family transcriptional regulator, transcriptional repressor for nem operon
MRALAGEPGIKAASLYYHFSSKADLAAAVARRYWEDSAATLEAFLVEDPAPAECLRRYPETFLKSLESYNCICLCSFMAAEYSDPPRGEGRMGHSSKRTSHGLKELSLGAMVGAQDAKNRAKAIFAAVAGAQLMARSRSDITLFDTLIDSYRAAGTDTSIVKACPIWHPLEASLRVPKAFAFFL